jgi:hypothetical protein
MGPALSLTQQELPIPSHELSLEWGIKIVMSPSKTYSDAGNSMASGIGANDQFGFCLSSPWLHIRDLVWTTLLIGAGVSAFTTGDMWMIPSILVLLCVIPTTFLQRFVTVIGT